MSILRQKLITIFDFNTETGEMEIVEQSLTSEIATKKEKTIDIKLPEDPTAAIVTLTGNTLKLSLQAVELLKAKPGDKIEVLFDKDQKPFIKVSEAGNVLGKNNSISYRGKQKESLAALGTSFSLLFNNGVYYLESTTEQVEEVTSKKKSKKIITTEESTNPEDFGSNTQPLIKTPFNLSLEDTPEGPVLVPKNTSFVWDDIEI